MPEDLVIPGSHPAKANIHGHIAKDLVIPGSHPARANIPSNIAKDLVIPGSHPARANIPSNLTKDLVIPGSHPAKANIQSYIAKDLVIPGSHPAKTKTPSYQANIEGPRSNTGSLPSYASDDLIGFSDIPIMKVDDSGLTAYDESIDGNEGHVLLVPSSSKPQGSAYISVKMSIGTSSPLVIADLCVDTGADFTICDSAFLLAHYGKDALASYLTYPDRIPKLRSATGHSLQMLGIVKGTLYLGECKLNLDVLVYEGTVSVFLLGSDAFYDRLI